MANKRLTVQIGPQLEEILEKMAREEGVTKAQIIRRAIAVLKFLDDERSLGHKVTISNKDDKIIKELVVQ